MVSLLSESKQPKKRNSVCERSQGYTVHDAPSAVSEPVGCVKERKQNHQKKSNETVINFLELYLA